MIAQPRHAGRRGQRQASPVGIECGPQVAAHLEGQGQGREWLTERPAAHGV
ncbi:MAG: hypothetical protein ACRDIB_05910 [Ardenticatenaceae bacterium]